MECDVTEKVSLLMDGELAAEEAKQVKQHLFACAVCRQAHQEFVRLREHLLAYERETSAFERQRVLRDILTAKPAPVWHRRVSLPAPAFAALLLLLFGLAAWVITARLRQSPHPEPPSGNRPTAPAARPVPQPGIDFTRFDTGERAVNYKTRRAEGRQNGP